MTNESFDTGSESSPEPEEEGKFVEVLTSDVTGDLMGYRFGGSRPGPTAVLAGNALLMSALFDRLMEVPTLPWMSGSLYLITLESADSEAADELHDCLPDVPLDGLVMLPYDPRNGGHQRSVDAAYWTGLRLCSELGMIKGRGVPS